MKKIVLLLTIPTVAMLYSCGGPKTDDKPKMAGMMDLDLSAQGLPLTITVPDSSKGKLEMVVQSWGATEIKVGKNFEVSISESEGDIALAKSDIAGNDVNKFKRYLVDEPTAILWESQITDPEFHFYTIVKAGDKTYVIEDIKGDMFSESDTKIMVESAKSIKAKEAPKS